jgi:hypothetical protein
MWRGRVGGQSAQPLAQPVAIGLQGAGDGEFKIVEQHAVHENRSRSNHSA